MLEAHTLSSDTGIQISLFWPKLRARSVNCVIYLLDMALSKEELENEELRQEQVLDYETGSVLMVLMVCASPEA